MMYINGQSHWIHSLTEFVGIDMHSIYRGVIACDLSQNQVNKISILFPIICIGGWLKIISTIWNPENIVAYYRNLCRTFQEN